MFKLDMMKAFDRVSWDFLERLLGDLQTDFLLPSWTTWEPAVFRSGSSAGFFQSTRGLKQGDPLSPILFILVVDSLSRGLNDLVQSGLMESYSLPRHAPSLSHLCFADDLVVFTRGSRRSVKSLFLFLQVYELASGQRVNWSKSSFLISRHATHRKVRWIEDYTGVPRTQWPFRYLGNVLYKGRKRRSHFQHLLDKFNARLAGWQGHLLSPGGRLILIKHVLSTIPIHVLSVFDPPKAVLSQLESICSRFLWRSHDQHTKRVWRSWDRMAYPTL